MKVLIDGHMIGSGEGGNERYTKNLFTSLVSHDENINLLTVEKGKSLAYKNVIVNNKAVVNLYRLFYLIPIIVEKYKIDIVHSNYISPFYKNAKFVITVHDFCFKYYPKYFSLRERLIFNFFLPYSMKTSDAIIVPSEFTRQELERFYPEYKSKVFVIYEAVDNVFKSVSKLNAIEKIKKLYNIKNPYILALNGKNRKKNINFVIKAYLNLDKRYSNLNLVIVGGKYNIEERLLKDKRIIILDFIKDNELNLFFNAAILFVYYSIYEGFGLPVVEALACSTPVICSDIEVHREITKNKLLYANPFDLNDLSEKIKLVLTDKKIKNKLIKEEKRISKMYNWEKTAKQTEAVYEEVLKK